MLLLDRAMSVGGGGMEGCLPLAAAACLQLALCQDINHSKDALPALSSIATHTGPPSTLWQKRTDPSCLSLAKTLPASLRQTGFGTPCASELHQPPNLAVSNKAFLIKSCRQKTCCHIRLGSLTGVCSASASSKMSLSLQCFGVPSVLISEMCI